MAMPKASCARPLRRAAARKRKTPARAGRIRPQSHRHEPTPNAPSMPSRQQVAADDASVGSRVAWLSDSMRQVVVSLHACQDVLLSESQMKLLKQATAALGDALAGPGAPPSQRLALRRGLRAAALVAHGASFAVRLWTLLCSAAHLNGSALGLVTEAELASALTALLLAVPYTSHAPASSGSTPLLLRAVAATSAIAADWLEVGLAAGRLGRLDLLHPHLAPLMEEVTAAVQAVVDLLVASWGLVESGQELRQVAQEAAADNESATGTASREIHGR